MDSLILIFREVRDPRDFNAQHDLAAMLFVALAATLCGAKSCVGFADFAAAHEDELAEIVDLRHGAPSHDSFSRVFRLLDPEEMARVFLRFVAALREGLGLDPAAGVVAVDGKRLRRGYKRGRSHMPPLMVSVWDAETRLSLATRHAPGGNEVAATLAVLKSLVLKGCIVTGDALHCHPAMAAEVRARGAHYALKLKANNAPLFNCALAAFAAADAGGKLKSYEESDSDHGGTPPRQRDCATSRRACLPRSRRPRPHRDRTPGQRQADPDRALRGVVQAPHASTPARSDAPALECGKSTALASRRRLPRGRCPDPQELWAAKPCRHPPHRHRHLARTPR